MNRLDCKNNSLSLQRVSMITKCVIDIDSAVSADKADGAVNRWIHDM